MEQAPPALPISNLNSLGLEIRTTPEKGRGVYATHHIPKGAVVETSPVLLFTANEWEAHGRHTVLDHYTFVWRIPGEKSSMALALGLGSIFNHSSCPNVSYTRMPEAQSIKYVALVDIRPEEELCISYGDESRLWFKPSESISLVETEDTWDELRVLSVVDNDADNADVLVSSEETSGTDWNEAVKEDDLPFERVKPVDDEDGDKPGDIKTFHVWVVDVHEPQQISIMLRFIREAGLDTVELQHLRRVRKAIHTSILLSVTDPPPLPLPLPPPYLHPVPLYPARDKDDLVEKNSLWPMNGIGRNPEERTWTRGEIEWVRTGFERAVETARLASEAGELPIGTYVCACVGDPLKSVAAHDTRVSTGHPLRHAVVAAIRSVAQLRRSQSDATSAASRNGDAYLLTSLALFVTHEPCIMCTMALVHSRVKDVFFLRSMPGTGGCGGAEGKGCGVVGKGVNHRFGVWKWKDDWLGLGTVERGTDI